MSCRCSRRIDMLWRMPWGVGLFPILCGRKVGEGMGGRLEGFLLAFAFSLTRLSRNSKIQVQRLRVFTRIWQVLDYDLSNRNEWLSLYVLQLIVKDPDGRT